MKAVWVLGLQLLTVWLVTMTPFLGFCNRFAQFTAHELSKQVRKGGAQRFDYVSPSKCRENLMVYMQVNPAQWKLYDMVITPSRGRLIAALVLLVDISVVWWRYYANRVYDAGGDSGSWMDILVELVSPTSGWGAWTFLCIMGVVLLSGVIFECDKQQQPKAAIDEGDDGGDDGNAKHLLVDLDVSIDVTGDQAL
jgi:hypothetical protein